MEQKKTIRTEIVDGLKIIIGTDRANIAAPETNAIVDVELTRTTEFAEVEKYKLSANKYKMLAMDAYVSFTKSAKGSAQAQEFWDTYVMRRTQHNDELKIVSEKIALMVAKRRDLMILNAVYHDVKPEDKIVEDAVIADYIAKRAALAVNEVLKFDDSADTIDAIPNFRNRDWYKYDISAWTYGKITVIGEDLPVGSKTFDLLTDIEIGEIETQKEAERIALLDAVARDAEKQEAIKRLLAVATNMRLELEVQGNADAITIARDYYNAELALLDVKYA